MVEVVSWDILPWASGISQGSIICMGCVILCYVQRVHFQTQLVVSASMWGQYTKAQARSCISLTP